VESVVIKNASGEDVTGNYMITKTEGTLSITPRALILTEGDKTRVYGEANDTAKYTTAQEYTVAAKDETNNTGLVNGDTVASVTQGIKDVITASSNAGTYADGTRVSNAAITRGGVDVLKNYTVTYIAGKFVITPRPVDVTVTNTTKTYGDANPSATAFVDTKQGFGILLNGHTGNDDIGGRSSTNGTIPVLFTNGTSKKLDGIYKINYDADKLAIEPAAQKATIPDSKEIKNDVNKDFTITYQSQEAGSYDVTFGNGIVAIYPVDSTALTAIDGNDRKTIKSVVATGILTSIQDLGVTADQIRAVYIFTTPEGATTTSTQKND
jgi:hypothetical protein